jgi:hypothetical protein
VLEFWLPEAVLERLEAVAKQKAIVEFDKNIGKASVPNAILRVQEIIWDAFSGRPFASIRITERGDAISGLCKDLVGKVVVR